MAGFAADRDPSDCGARMSAWNLEQITVRCSLNAQETLGLAWLCEQAARSCAVDGKHRWSEQLRADAARLRAAAMREPDQVRA